MSISRRGSLPRPKLVLILAVVLFTTAWLVLRRGFDLRWAAAHEQELRAIYAQHPWLALSAAFLLYTIVTALSLPIATLLTLAYGWFFGWWLGVAIVSLASTTGATGAFLSSRYLVREPIRRQWGDRLSTIETALQRDGAYYLLALRLVPLFPFFVVNLLMGLTPMRWTTFWWASQLGMLPATCVYVYAGAAMPNLQRLVDQGARGILSPQLGLALALLGLFPLAVRWLIPWIWPTGPPRDAT